MSNTTQSLLIYLKNASRYPKVEVTPATVPTVQVTNEEWNNMLGVLSGHESEVEETKLFAFDKQLRAKVVGFGNVDKAGHVMTIGENDTVVWNEAGNNYNVCGTMPVSSGDIIYLSTYNIGSYDALPWVIVNAGGTVLQQADEVVSAGAYTGERRIEVTGNGTLYVYMQYNIGMPVISKVVSTDAMSEKTDAAVADVATFSNTKESVTITTAVYIDNTGLEKGYIQDTMFSAGNNNNGVYGVAVTKGEVIKIVNANLGSYGGLYWSLFNDEGIVQHGVGANNTLADDIVFIAKASGTLYVSFGLYDSDSGEYIKPSIYKVADLNGRQDGVTNSLKSIFENASLVESSDVTTVTGHYIMVEDGEVCIFEAGNNNNGYLAVSLTKGQYVKVKSPSSSAFSNISWALADANGNALDWSGVIGYRTMGEDFDLIAPADSTLYIGFGYYDETSETYPKPTVYEIADSGQQLQEHGDSIDIIDKTLYKRLVPFDGVTAPMIIRYGSGTTLILDESVGNQYFKCFHVSVSKGDKFLLKGASVGGYDGVAWGVFNSNGNVLQQSSESTSYNTTFADCLIEVERDGILYVNNYSQVDDTLCELYKIEEDELDGNPQTKPIVVCGDSTSQGLGESFESSMLDHPRRIYRMGVGSENVWATAARMGAIPSLCMPVTIPAAAEAVEVKLTARPLFKQTYNADGTPATPALQNDYVSPNFAETAHFYCSIGGVEGDLYTSDTDSKTYFVRSTAGSAVTLSVPTEVVPLKVQRVRNSLLVCLMGTNGGFLNYDAEYNADNSLRGDQTDEQRAQNLFDVMKRIFAYMGGDMIVIGFFCGELPEYYTKAFYEAYEALCEKEFGEKFINARLWLKDYAWQLMGLTLTSEDKTYMANGFPPVQLFDGGTAVHLSTATNEVFAQYVADRITHLGY